MAYLTYDYYSDSDDDDNGIPVIAVVGHQTDAGLTTETVPILLDRSPTSSATPYFDAGLRVLEEKPLLGAEVRFIHQNPDILSNTKYNVIVGQCSYEQFLKCFKPERARLRPHYYESEIPGEYHYLRCGSHQENAIWKKVIFLECSSLHRIVLVVEKPLMPETGVRDLD